MNDEIKNHVTFRADFPDEAVWDEGGMVVPDGRSVMNAISEALKTQGYQVGLVAQHSFYGWAVDVKAPGGQFWCMVQNMEPFVLIVKYRPSLWSFIAGRKEDKAGLPDFISHLIKIMKMDKRFHDLRLFTTPEYAAENRRSSAGR